MSAVNEKQKSATQTNHVSYDDEEDTSPLLRHDEEELLEVNEHLWWGIDAVFAFLATYLTHSSEDMAIWQRLIATVAVLGFGFGLCKVYFTSGLKRPMSGQHPIDKWWHMLIAHVGNIFFFWEWAVSLYRLFCGYYEEGTPILKIILQISFGIYISLWLSDVIAGVTHWFGDTTELYFFDYHHRDSRYMTTQSYVHHCWDSIALALVISAIVPPLRFVPILTTVRLAATQTNEFHMFSHCTSKEIPDFIQFLQKYGIVLTWKAHKEHHKPPHLIDYCVFNGWANPFMNKVLPGPVTQWVERNIRDNPKFHQFKKVLDA
jgi:hypothetical protein